MTFKGWEVEIQCVVEDYDIVTNENTFAVIREEDTLGVILKEVDGYLKISNISYNGEVFVNHEEKRVLIKIDDGY
ncbi:hypothetical protein [Staphylococcus massiliensis]|uniref:Uncharacterized protein n=1 Tax=Staphylococcus massiliensis S46 TaxID=1229783 RepID=K9ALN7_9STAP|nr:hypothetical protein [Staphylococcus massiliensis]EKU48219.1 hypothetical protein C273_05917 [Staphylococcus massiliensis S46]MCG3399519.1 hypothetical protein [Staphylococcus massiliensis]MCG3402028.1 hypothetical protein [Staphylococcus massiliensis]MCG3412743.1 hypothetical protein [Staphylococcus massiliensis]PNZ97918.1 hypothetical protein CD133_09805 [Staphylococcus massiliensis CCUG 55927]